VLGLPVFHQRRRQQHPGPELFVPSPTVTRPPCRNSSGAVLGPSWNFLQCPASAWTASQIIRPSIDPPHRLWRAALMERTRFLLAECPLGETASALVLVIRCARRLDHPFFLQAASWAQEMPPAIKLAAADPRGPKRNARMGALGGTWHIFVAPPLRASGSRILLRSAKDRTPLAAGILRGGRVISGPWKSLLDGGGRAIVCQARPLGPPCFFTSHSPGLVDETGTRPGRRRGGHCGQGLGLTLARMGGVPSR